MKNNNNILDNISGRFLISLKLFVFGLVVSFIGGCEDETVNPLFEQKAIVRSEANKAELRTMLTSSEHGWDVKYKPDEEETGYFRFNFRFKENGTVETRSNYDAVAFRDTPESTESLYDILQGTTTKLSFTTRGLLHRLSDSRLGFKGDFEFLYYGKDENGEDLVFRTNREQDTLIFKKGTPESLTKLEVSLDIISDFRSLSNISVYRKMQYTRATGDAELYDFSINVLRILTVRKLIEIEGIFSVEEFETGIDFWADGIMLDSLRTPGESYIKNVIFSYNDQDAIFETTLEDGSKITVGPSMTPLIPVADHKRLSDHDIVGRLAYFHRDSDLPVGLTTASFEALYEEAENVDGFSLYNDFGLNFGPPVDFFFLYLTDDTSVIALYTTTPDDQNDRIVFIRNGYPDSNSEPTTVGQNAFLDFLFDSEGFFVENLGSVTQFSNHVYTFTSVKDPSIRIAFYLLDP